MVNGKFYGEPNLQRLFEALAKAAGEQMGAAISVASIRRVEAETPQPAR